jgi:hypothetical protein
LVPMRSRRRSATGWSAAGTLLAALAGSVAGAAAVAGAEDAAAGASALFPASLAGSAAGAVATVAGGVVAGAVGAVAVSFVLSLVALSLVVSCVGAAAVAGASVPLSDTLAISVAGDTVAVVSSLKSLGVGGGTLAGSGIGTAASMADWAAVLRGMSLCASADVADTVRKVAATAIRTRSNPPREFTQSRIVAFPRMICSVVDTASVSSASFRSSAGVESCGTLLRNNSRQTITQASLRQPVPHEATHDKLTRGETLGQTLCQTLGHTNAAFLPWGFSFVCHLKATVHMFHGCQHLRQFSAAIETP